jgi:hypothetical protein
MRIRIQGFHYQKLQSFTDEKIHIIYVTACNTVIPRLQTTADASSPQKRKPTTSTLTINVPLFKKLRDIIFFLRDNNFLSHFEGHFEGAKTFLTP